MKSSRCSGLINNQSWWYYSDLAKILIQTQVTRVVYEPTKRVHLNIWLFFKTIDRLHFDFVAYASWKLAFSEIKARRNEPSWSFSYLIEAHPSTKDEVYRAWTSGHALLLAHIHVTKSIRRLFTSYFLSLKIVMGYLVWRFYLDLCSVSSLWPKKWTFLLYILVPFTTIIKICVYRGK